MPFNFEKLDVYQLAVHAADSVARQIENFPPGYAFMADQLLRASVSIPVNIAEGNGRLEPRDRRRFFGIARGSTYECIPLLQLACRRGLIPEAEQHAIYNELDEMCRMLNGLIRSIPNKTRARPRHA